MKLRLLLVSFVMMLFTVPAFAQDGMDYFTEEEQALLAEISDSVDALRASPYLDIRQTFLNIQTVSFEDESHNQTNVIRNMQSVLLSDGEITDYKTSIIQANEGFIVNGIIEAEAVYVDDQHYLEILSGTGIFEGFDGQGWMLLDEEHPGKEVFLSIDNGHFNLIETMLANLDWIESVEAVELDSEIGSELVRSIIVTWGMEGFQNQGFLSMVLEELMLEDSQETLSAIISDLEFTLTYSFNAEGQLVDFAMDATFNMNLDDTEDLAGITFGQSIYESSSYIYLEEAPIITAPEVD